MNVAQEKSERLNLRLTEAEAAMLEKLADAEGMNASEMIRSLLRGAFAKRFPDVASPFETAEERFARQIFGLAERHPQPHLRGVIDTFSRTLATKLRRPDIRTASDRCVLLRRRYDEKHGAEGALAAEELAASTIEACMNDRRAPGVGGRVLEALNVLHRAYLR